MTILLFLLAAAVAPPPEAASHAAESAVRLATSLFYAGRPADGADLLEAVRPRLERAGLDRPGVVRMQIEHARMVHYTASQAGAPASRAAELSSAALAAAEALGDDVLVGDASDLLGLTLYWQALDSGRVADFETPVPHYARALTIRRKREDRRGVAETLFHQGLLFQNRPSATAQDQKRAEALFLEARALINAEDHPVELSYLERHLAAIAQERGDLDGALAAFRRSLALREQAGFRIYVPPALLAIAEVLLARRDRVEAADTYRRALREAEAVNAHRFVLDAHVALGGLAEAAGDRASARTHYQAALAAAAAAGNEVEAASLRERLERLEVVR